MVKRPSFALGCEKSRPARSAAPSCPVSSLASRRRRTLLSRGCRPWMHGSSPCMTNLADYRGRTILHIVSKNALYSIRSDTRLCGGEDREMSWRRFPGYVEVDTSKALREKPKRVARAAAWGGTMIDIAENAAAYFVDRHATSAYRDKFAFVEAGGEQRSLTYGKLAEETGRVAHLLERHQIEHENRVALLLLDKLEFPIIFWGCLKAGVIPVALNTLLATDRPAEGRAACSFQPEIHRRHVRRAGAENRT